MIKRGNKDRITLRKNPERVRILYGDKVIADTRRALELCETGYPPRQYIPQNDIDTSCLQRSETTTHCPFKGDAAYYNLISVTGAVTDAAWSYDHPREAVADIKGHLAFDASLVDESIG